MVLLYHIVWFYSIIPACHQNYWGHTALHRLGMKPHVAHAEEKETTFWTFWSIDVFSQEHILSFNSLIAPSLTACITCTYTDTQITVHCTRATLKMPLTHSHANTHVPTNAEKKAHFNSQFIRDSYLWYDKWSMCSLSASQAQGYKHTLAAGQWGKCQGT